MKKDTEEIEQLKREIAQQSQEHAKRFFAPESASMEFLITKRGKFEVPTLCTENICKVLLLVDIFGHFRFDEFKQMYEYREPIGEWRPLKDMDIITLQTRIQTVFEFFQTVGERMVESAIHKVSTDHTIDSAIEYVKKLAWDETPRLDTWLSKVYGVEDNVYHRAVASNWLKGLVKRIIDPGCKFDFVLVLEGSQGIQKSKSLQTLASKPWYVETTMATDTKDFFMQFHGKVVVEFSEGETLNRTEVKRMKAIISTEVDRYRLPFGRVTQDFPRRCVFAMTTNQYEYLKDDSGNRRWFPVKVLKDDADVEWLAENRDQLYAEAYHRLTVLKETYWEFPKAETLAEQKERRIREPNEEKICDWYLNSLTEAERDQGVTTHDCFQRCFHGGFTAPPIKRYEEVEIANVFKQALNLIRKQKMKEGVRTYRYYNEATEIMDEIVSKSVVKQEEMEF